ncbi:MAG: hypothetical protein ABSH41_29680 [Syntrophobacteraceae bacterium]
MMDFLIRSSLMVAHAKNNQQKVYLVEVSFGISYCGNCCRTDFKVKMGKQLPNMPNFLRGQVDE